MRFPKSFSIMVFLCQLELGLSHGLYKHSIVLLLRLFTVWLINKNSWKFSNGLGLTPANPRCYLLDLFSLTKCTPSKTSCQLLGYLSFIFCIFNFVASVLVFVLHHNILEFLRLTRDIQTLKRGRGCGLSVCMI